MEKKYKKLKYINNSENRVLKEITDNKNYENILKIPPGKPTYDNFTGRANHFIFLLSELIDNSIESFRKMYSDDNIREELDNSRFQPEIEILLTTRSVIIKDNAIGFCESDNDFTRIWEYVDCVDNEHRDLESWSEFNDGFKSAIIGIGEETEVHFKHYKSKNPIKIKIEKDLTHRINAQEFNFKNYKHGTIITITKLTDKTVDYLEKSNNNLDRLKQNIADKYKKYLNKNGNGFGIEINIFIDDDDLSKYCENYEYRRCGKNIIPVNKKSININKWFDNYDTNEEKWNELVKFLTHKCNDKYNICTEKLYNSIYTPELKEHIKEQYFLTEYSEAFHKNLMKYFKSYSKLGEYEALIQLKKCLLLQNNEIKDTIIRWQDNINIENNCNIPDSKLCENNTHKNHLVVISTWITNDNMKNPKAKYLKFQTNVNENTGYTIEGKDKLIIFGDNNEPFKKRIFMYKIKSASFETTNKISYGSRITGTILVPSCFNTDNNKKELINKTRFISKFGDCNSPDSLFYKLFIKSGKILCVHLLTTFLNYSKTIKQYNDKNSNKSDLEYDKKLIKERVKNDINFQLLPGEKLKTKELNEEELSKYVSNNQSKLYTLGVLDKVYNSIKKMYIMNLNGEKYNVMIIADDQCDSFIKIEYKLDDTLIVYCSSKIWRKMLENDNVKVIKTFQIHCLLIFVREWIAFYILLKSQNNDNDAAKFIQTLNNLYTWSN